MSDTPIAQHLDAFRNLARRHLEKGSVEGLAALKQTLEMDDTTFAELLKPLLISETPTVKPQKQLPRLKNDSQTISHVPKPERKPIAILNNNGSTKPENTRYIVRLTVSPTNFLSVGLENADTGDLDYKGTFGQLFDNGLKPGDVITLNHIPHHGLNNLDYVKVGFDPDVANEYPFLEDQPVGFNPKTGCFYVDIPAQENTDAFRYYLSNEVVDKLDSRLGYADFREGCLVTGFVISKTHFHITYVKQRPFHSIIQSSK